MYWIAAGLAVSGVTAALASAPAPPVHRPPTARQQLVECMTKQMSASRTISYLEAENVCKLRIQSQTAMLASSAAAKAAGGGRSR
jgi:hypothetical protein